MKQPVFEMKKNNNGFTLLELMIVMGLIAILSVPALISFAGARKRSKDVRRKSDLRELQKAMELYKLDQNPQVYPTTGAFPAVLCDDCWSQGPNCGGNLYMKKTACESVGVNPTPYLYTLDPADSLKYSLTACLEDLSDPDKDVPTHATCNSQGKASFTISEP